LADYGALGDGQIEWSPPHHFSDLHGGKGTVDESRKGLIDNASSPVFRKGLHRMHPIQCKCGAVRGHLEGTGTSSRLICYCTDCRAFARFLGQKAEVLNEQGGTEIVQVSLPRLRLTQGLDQVAAVRLSAKGMVRWYAACCKTPIGSTMANPKLGFIGLVHCALTRSRIDTDFGTTIALVNTCTALGDKKPVPRGLPGVIARFLLIAVATRVSGRYKRAQLFNSLGSPQVEPSVLAPDELARLKSAG
jgi:hypothetical protein